MDLKSWNETMLDNRSVISTQKIYKNLARVPLGRDECKGSKCPSTKGSRLRQGFGGQAGDRQKSPAGYFEDGQRLAQIRGYYSSRDKIV